MQAAIQGLGSYLPERVVTNEDWARWVDTSDEWIVERTGIRRRRFVAEDETTATVATAAARAALEDAGLAAEEVGEIILATDTPEVPSPDTAAHVQHALGVGHVPTYDLAGAGCAGWVQGLDLARCRTQIDGRRVLVIGVEVLSRIMSWKDRNTCVLFGDGAGAAVVGREGPLRIVEAVMRTDGAAAGLLGKEVGGTRTPFSREELEAGRHDQLVMNGRAVFRAALKRMREAVDEVLERAGVGLDAIELLVPHQANQRIVNALAENLALPPERLVSNVEEYGNTGSASLPIALREARAAGRLPRRGYVLLTAFGAGFHWGAALLHTG